MGKLRVYTSTIHYKGENKLDVSYKSGDRVFAPSKELLWDFKNGVISPIELHDLYGEEMEESYEKNRERWEEVLGMEEVVLCCYCGRREICHTRLLAQILVRKGAEYKGIV